MKPICTYIRRLQNVSATTTATWLEVLITPVACILQLISYQHCETKYVGLLTRKAPLCSSTLSCSSRISFIKSISCSSSILLARLLSYRAAPAHLSLPLPEALYSDAAGDTLGVVQRELLKSQLSSTCSSSSCVGPPVLSKTFKLSQTRKPRVCIRVSSNLVKL